MSKRFTLLTILLLVLAACSGSALPAEARTVVLRGFDPQSNPRIDRAQQVTPLAEDLALGAEEVWCVNIVYTCWSCEYGRYRTCAENRLLRRIGGRWETAVLMTDEDRALWEERGCLLLAPIVGD